MEKFKIKKISNYKNRGQAKEQDFRYHFTGRLEKADNKKASETADFADIQIKSAKASIAENDIADRFAYITEDRMVYLMTREEFERFLTDFSYMDKNSKTGKSKVRIKNESKKMLRWLESH